MLRETCATHILIGRLDFSRLDVLPTHKVHGIVEQQVAFGLTLAHQQHRILIGLMLTGEPVVVHIIQNIHVMDENGCLFHKEVLCLLQSPTRFQQFTGFVAETNQWRVVLLFDIIYDLLCKMMDIDYKPVIALSLQLTDVPFQQRFAPHWHQRFGHSVCQRFQSCAKASSQYHCLSHFASSIWLIPCSRWQIRTSMPNFSWICSARCWAE